MKRSFIATLVVAVALAAALLGMRLIQTGANSPVYADALAVSLDMDISDGPCTDIDATAPHACGSTYKVAICATGLYSGYPVGSFTFDVTYDDTKNNGTEVANVAPALDDNPDASAGTTKWGDGLGVNWACDNSGSGFPTGNTPAAGGDAFLACDGTAVGATFLLGDNETAGVIATVELKAADCTVDQSDTIGIATTSYLAYSTGGTMGECDPDSGLKMDCIGGTVNLTAPEPTPTPAPPQPQCDIADMGMTANGKAAPDTVTMLVDSVATIAVSETIKNLGTVDAGAPECLAPFLCMDNADNDFDTVVNDGCPPVLTAETVCAETACTDADGKAPWDTCDDDSDGWINDGCPQVGQNSELIAWGYAQVAWLVTDGADAPLNPALLRPRLEAIGGAADNYLDGDACIVGTPPLFYVIPCEETQVGAVPPTSPSPALANRTGNCTDKIDNDGDGTCDWGPVNGACTDPLTIGFPDPECTDIDHIVMVPYVQVPGLTVLPTGGTWKIDRGLEIYCAKAGSYTVKVTGSHMEPAQCANAIDDDADTVVNDGCAKKGATAETGDQCLNDDDDDGDGWVNDGCPSAGAGPESQWPFGYDPNPDNDVSSVSVTVNCQSREAAMVKDCDVETEGIQTNCNLWLMDPDFPGGVESGTYPPVTLPPADANGCVVPELGKGCLAVDVWLLNAEDTDDANDSDTDAECLGAWEHQIKYEHKLVRFQNDLNPKTIDTGGGSPDPDVSWLESTGRVANCTFSLLTENYMYEACITTGTENGPCGNGIIEKMLIIPQTNDMIYRDGFRPTKDNGVVTDVLDENCETTDIYAEPMNGLLPGGLTPICGDIHITIRMLEGDTDLDCDVDVVDEMSVAFRYGAFWGLQLYDQWFDLEPKFTDYDIDIKDLQFVFGRDGSYCQDPIPDDQKVPVVPPQMATPMP